MGILRKTFLRTGIAFILNRRLHPSCKNKMGLIQHNKEKPSWLFKLMPSFLEIHIHSVLRAIYTYGCHKYTQTYRYGQAHERKESFTTTRWPLIYKNKQICRVRSKRTKQEFSSHRGDQLHCCPETGMSISSILQLENKNVSTELD